MAKLKVRWVRLHVPNTNYHRRLAGIRRGVMVTLNLLNTIFYCRGETIP